MSVVVRIFAPTGRDAELIYKLLRENDIAAEVCSDPLQLFADDDGSPIGPLLIAEEALTPPVVHHLSEAVARQPPWSDIPLLVLTTGGRETLISRRMEHERLALGSAVLLERPIRTRTLLSSVGAALRARNRQYQVRDALLDRDRLVAQLHAERERLRVSLDSLPVGVMLADSRGVITYANAALQAILQAPNAPRTASSSVSTLEVVSPETWTLFRPDGSPLPAANMPRYVAIRTRRPVPAQEFQYRRADGTVVFISIAAAPILDSTPGAQGEVTAVVVVILDLSAQKQSERALVQSEKLAAVGRLAASISHEINNPLEAVTNLLYLVDQDGTLPPQTRTYLGLAERELTRVSQIASQTLRFHRQSTRPREVVPEDLIESVIGIYQGRLHNSHIQVVRDHRPAAPVTCYEGDIRQVLNNLVGNAIDSMRGGGRLTLRTHNATLWSTGTPGIRITVADTGHGMSPDVRHRIFEAFYTTKGNNGTGLGLWISRGIIEKHHGRLDVASWDHGPRTGTVFSLFLPTNLTPEATESPAP